MFEENHTYQSQNLSDLIKIGKVGDPVILDTVEGKYFGFYQGINERRIARFSIDSRGKIRPFSVDLENRVLLLKRELVVPETHERTPIMSFLLDTSFARYDESVEEAKQTILGSRFNVTYRREDKP